MDCPTCNGSTWIPNPHQNGVIRCPNRRCVGGQLRDKDLTDLALEEGMVTSVSQLRRLVLQGGVKYGRTRVERIDEPLPKSETEVRFGRYKSVVINKEEK